MPNYNTQGITSSAGSDPRNLGGSEGYGNPTASTSSGLMSSTANATTNDDNNDDEPGFFESIANLFSGAGADLPSDKSDDDGDSGISFYDSPMFTPSDGGSDNDTTPQGGLPFETTAADRALYEALGVDVPEVYKGTMGEEEPDPNFDPDVLQDALQPEPIIVEEIEVNAGDTLTAIAEEKGLPVQAVIDANPQIKNPDLIRPGEVVSVPDPRFEGVPKPRGVADSPRLSESTVTPIETDTGTDPRELGGAEGYGSGDTPAEAETSEGLMTPPKESTPLSKLLDFIGAGEGDYDSSNTGTDSEGNIVHYSHSTVRDGKKLSEMTLDEIRSYQAIKDPNDKDRLFTVGKYQLVPDTFEIAVKGLGLEGGDVLTPEIQDQMGVFLVSKKPGRSRLSKYLSGDTAVSSDKAMLDLAMEFASVPVPKAIKKGTYGSWPKRDILAGESFYADPKSKKGGNRAAHTVAETKAVLKGVQGVLTSDQAHATSPRPQARN